MMRTTLELTPLSPYYHTTPTEGMFEPQQIKRASAPLHSESSATLAARGLLATDHVILNHGQVTWTTPEPAPFSPNYHTTPTGGRFSSRQI
ncbi:hypothetical protein TNCV_110691 [Trichonephila clavipes]|nr:hypothetical protein TNCV_110691 [Trichonephila clavipes]